MRFTGQRFGNVAYYGHLALSMLRHIDNWPNLAIQTLARREQALTIKVGGLAISCPASVFAVHPVVEVVAADSYHLKTSPSPWKELIAQARVVVDIGAHIGSFALALCCVNKTVRCYCFEPASLAFDFLTRNVDGNHLTSRIVPVNAAVSNKAGKLEFWQDRRGGGQSSKYPMTFHATGAKSLEHREFALTTVNVQALEVIFSNLSGTGGPVDVVKIDCEGSEYDLLLDTPDGIWDGVSGIILEYHPVDNHHYGELDRRLRALGFALDDREERGCDFGVGWYSRHV